MGSSAQPRPTNIMLVSEPTPPAISAQPSQPEFTPEWELDSECVHRETDGKLVLRKTHDGGPGSERGLVGKLSLRNLVLEFDLHLQENSIFLAKIHQREARNQLSNSYHLMCRGKDSYLARHNHIFSSFALPLESWFRLSFSYADGSITVRRNGGQLAHAQDRFLEEGYCFLGLKGGAVQIRDLRINSAEAPKPRPVICEYERLSHALTSTVPRVSIVTTVYDRLQCLERCLRSVQALNFMDYEHIIVADAPPAHVLKQMENLVAVYNGNSGKHSFSTLKTRHNDWGISPAAAGLSVARGKYVCFLSDDNGYVPDHFDKLVVALDQDPSLGFVYCSCLYAGRALLRPATPRPGAIDLGQPLFRRELFDRYLGGSIPFHEFGWDWRMIETFLKNGVRWRHLDDATFVFRLANYPHLIVNSRMERA